MALQWNEVDKAACSQREVVIHQQNMDPRDVDNKKLPTDVHLITFTHDGKEYCDAVRAAKMVDIFDIYHDKIKEAGKGGEVLSIKSGYGTIKPILFNNTQKDNK